MSYKLPMGPFHPGLEEPYKLEMICEGETICDAKLHIGFNFRGIEQLAETRNYVQVVALMERVCGICSFIHTLTLCQALEKLTSIEPPPRAQYIRVVMAELEQPAFPRALGGYRRRADGVQNHVYGLFRLPGTGNGTYCRQSPATG